jgi:hypothetical protein
MIACPSRAREDPSPLAAAREMFAWLSARPAPSQMDELLDQQR